MEKQQTFQGQIECISILRLLSAFGIALYHIGTFNDYVATPQAGVSLFFCISAFLTMYTTQNSQLPKFILKRLIRIVPLYWLMTLLTYIAIKIVPSVGNGTENYEQLIKSLFFIPYLRQSLKSGDVIKPLVGPGWTLYYDIYFTVIFYLCMKISHKHRGILASICCIVLLLFHGNTGKENPFLFIICDLWWASFITGICAFYIVRFLWNKKLTKGQLNGLLIIAVVTIGVMIFSEKNVYRNALLSGVALVSLITAFKKRKMPAFINYMGKISFSFYLIHYYVILVVDKFVDLTIISWKSIIAIVFIFASTIVLASLSYYLVENKFLLFLKRKLCMK